MFFASESPAIPTPARPHFLTPTPLISLPSIIPNLPTIQAYQLSNMASSSTPSSSKGANHSAGVNNPSDDGPSSSTRTGNSPAHSRPPADNPSERNTLNHLARPTIPQRPHRLGLGLAEIANRLPLGMAGITAAAYRAPFSALAKTINDRINQGEEKAVSPTEPKPASPTGARSGDLSNQSLQQAGTAKHNTDGVDAVISNPGAPTSPDVKTVQLAIPPTSVAPPAETRQNLVGISSQPGSSAQAEGNTETKPHADSTGIEDVRAGSHAETVQAEATRAEAPRGDIPAQMLAKTAAVRSSGPGTTTAGTKPGLWTKEPTTLNG
jgi:hypothetical protein